MNGVKSGIVHWPCQGSGEADGAVPADGAEGVGEDRAADQFQGGVDAVRDQLAHLVGEGAVVDEGMVDARGPQFPGPAGAAGGGDDGGAEVLRDGGRAQPDRGGAAADQQRLPGLEVQAAGQGSVGGLEHLRQRPDDVPRQAGLERDDLPGGDGDVLGVRAVVRAAHAAHHRGHLLSRPQPAVLVGLVDHADALDAGHARVGDHRVRLALAGGDLGLVDAERLHLDPHPAELADGHRHVLDLQCVEAAGPGDDDGPHRRRCGAAGCCRLAHAELLVLFVPREWEVGAGAPGTGARVISQW